MQIFNIWVTVYKSFLALLLHKKGKKNKHIYLCLKFYRKSHFLESERFCFGSKYENYLKKIKRLIEGLVIGRLHMVFILQRNFAASKLLLIAKLIKSKKKKRSQNQKSCLGCNDGCLLVASAKRLRLHFLLINDDRFCRDGSPRTVAFSVSDLWLPAARL